MVASGFLQVSELASYKFSPNIINYCLLILGSSVGCRFADKSFNEILDQNNHQLFIVDAALIYESGYDAHLDYVIVVTAQLKHRMERALNRNTLTREEILKRIEFQWPEEDKTSLADFVIHNDGTEAELNDQIVELFKKLV